MKIWIDLANAPHVQFFLPIIRRLVESRHDVVLSLRNFNQTVEIARRLGLEGAVIGTHGGPNNLGKIFNLASRSLQLAGFGAGIRADVAASHNSYPHMIAARLLGCRSVTLMDFEAQPANHIAFRMASRVIVPATFPTEYLRRYGARDTKVYRYQGFKEQVYLSDFQPDPNFFLELVRSCRLPGDWNLKDRILVTVRTPASMAAYHRFENALFDRLLDFLGRHSGATVVLLPRTQQQREYYQARFPWTHVPTLPLSGADLVYASDIVISAGGTMNREAAILGTPVYTIYAGELPAVDSELIKMGRMNAIRTESDVRALRVSRGHRKQILAKPGLCREIADLIIME